MSTLKTNPFAPSEGTCYNPSTGKECTTEKNGKYSAKDWKKNVTYGKNDGQKMTEPERVLIKAYLSHSLDLDGTETDGELIHLANENEIEINNLRARLHASEMLKRVEQAYNRSSPVVAQDKYGYLPHCTYNELLDNLTSFIDGRNTDEDDFDKWLGYAKWFTSAEQKLHKTRTKPLRFDNQGGWRPREGELDGESRDGGGCTIT